MARKRMARTAVLQKEIEELKRALWHACEKIYKLDMMYAVDKICPLDFFDWPGCPKKMVTADPEKVKDMDLTQLPQDCHTPEAENQIIQCLRDFYIQATKDVVDEEQPTPS